MQASVSESIRCGYTQHICWDFYRLGNVWNEVAGRRAVYFRNWTMLVSLHVGAVVVVSLSLWDDG